MLAENRILSLFFSLPFPSYLPLSAVPSLPCFLNPNRGYGERCKKKHLGLL